MDSGGDDDEDVDEEASFLPDRMARIASTTSRTSSAGVVGEGSPSSYVDLPPRSS
jgi:hypothetical protein